MRRVERTSGGAFRALAAAAVLAVLPACSDDGDTGTPGDDAGMDVHADTSADGGGDVGPGDGGGGDAGPDDAGGDEAGGGDAGPDDAGGGDAGGDDAGPADTMDDTGGGDVADGGGADATDAGEDATGGGEDVADGGGMDVADGGGMDGGDVTGGDPCPCDEGRICVRGVCIDDCEGQLEASAVQDALVADFQILQNRCITPGRAYSARAFGQVAEVVASAVGDGETPETRFELVTWQATAEAGMETVAETTVEGELDASLFPGSYLAAFGVGGDPYAWGWTKTGAGFPGSIAVAGVTEELQILDASGNFDAAFVDETALLVNGLGVGGDEGMGEGQGVYIADWSAEEGSWFFGKVVDNIGANSGALAIHEDVVLAGGNRSEQAGDEAWPDGSYGNKVFVLSLEDIMDSATPAPEPIDASEAQQLDIPSDFHFINDGRLVTREQENFQTTSLTIHTWETSDGSLQITGSTKITDGQLFDAARHLGGSSRLMLRHSAGYLITEGGVGAPQN